MLCEPYVETDPMNARRTLPSSNLTPEDLSGLKVLVVDDHANTVRLIGDVLRAAGVGQVYAANDGQRAREVLAIRGPDIMFTDSKMPIMDGLELTRSIRRAAVVPDPRVPNPEIPIIMVTSQRSVRDVQIARLAGVNEFVIKPFTPAGLLSRIQLVLKRPRPFIVSEVYVGPDRRRRVEINYAGAMRRMSDPAEVADLVERETTRDTISVELEAMQKLITARGGMDRSTLQMAYRVMQHTSFRARQVRDIMVQRASDSMISYVDAMGGAEACNPRIIDAHFDAIRDLLAATEMAPEAADKLTEDLENLVNREISKLATAA
jgi:CheY-like chemotaxis protein